MLVFDKSDQSITNSFNICLVVLVALYLVGCQEFDFSHPKVTDADTTPYKECDDCPTLVHVKLGSMHRSDNPNPWVRGDEEYGNGHNITLTKAFSIAQFEITNAQWGACLDDMGCTHTPDRFHDTAPDLPVVNLNWHDATEYTAWLSLKTGSEYRLPSEAEWEFVARGGTDTKFIKGDDPSTICDYANHRSSSSTANSKNIACNDGFIDEPAPVGSFEANPFGAYDMLGNVWEWVADCWHEADWPEKEIYNTAYPSDGPRNGAPFLGSADQCKTRVMRGGSWSNGSLNSFSPHFRNFDHADQRYPNLGFRIVRNDE